MSISSEIIALTTDRDNIRAALIAKEVVASGHGFDDFASDIEAIPTGPSIEPYIVTVTCDAAFAGLTITMSQTGQTSVSGVCPSSSPYTVILKPMYSGEWTISTTYQSKTYTSSVILSTWGNYTAELKIARVYGISRDITNSSPAWTRTDDAVGFTFSASVGDTAGSSSFDTCYPWNGIVRETINGDVMVKIPKFWFRRYLDGNIEHIEICDKQCGDYALHPAFQHNGSTQDYIYVGAYKMTSGYHSVSGSAPLVYTNRASFRSSCANRGTGYSQLDITTFSAIQMLILVETATNDSQSSIGRGYCDSNSSTINTGSCDSVANLTGRPSGIDGKVDVIYRGIEGFWGNVWEWIDGLNWNGGAYWICNNQSNFADSTSTNYTQLGYNGGSTGWDSSYITVMGCDSNNQAIILPATAGSGSATTYYADGCWSSTGWRVALRGGSRRNGSLVGLFTLAVDNDSSYAYSNTSSRLLYIPS